MRLIFTSAAVVATMLAFSAAEAQTPRDQTSAPGNPSTQADQSDASTFINQMSIAGTAEVQLGNIAVERASSGDVKNFGQMMAKDHTQANQDLAQVAARLNVKPTSQLDQKHLDLIDRISRLRGAEFDREYINAMVQGHEAVEGQLRARAGAASPATPAEKQPRSSEPNTPPPTTGTAPQTPTLSRGEASVGSHGSDDQRALTEWAQRTLPAVQKHLERAREIQQKLVK